MTYGPTTSPTSSVLARDGSGAPVSFWQSGLARGTLPRCPKILVDLETQEGATASVLLPGGVSRTLVDDPGREFVAEHHGVMYGPSLGATLGVYLVTEQRSDGLVACEVVVHNGVVDPSQPQSWAGCLRFKKIRVRVVTPGWTSTPIDCGQVGDWYFGIRVGFSRRFVCYQGTSPAVAAAAARLAGLADLKLEDATVLGAGLHAIPRLLGSRAEPLWNNVPPNGPLVPDTLTTNGYESGGAGINPIGGWEATENAARSYAGDVTRVMSRHGSALAHRRTGEPVWAHQWPNLGDYGLFDNRYAQDEWNWLGQLGSIVGAFGWDRSGKWTQIGPREVNPGPCASRATALAYQPNNGEHYQRATCRALAAWQTTRSWAARWLLRMDAADVMNSWQVGGLLTNRLLSARLHPGHGGDYLRFQAWIGEAVAAALTLTPPSSERDLYLQWRAQYLEHASLICMTNGFARAGTPPNSDNGVPWQEGLPPEYGACATFQLSFWTTMVHDLWVNGPPLVEVPKARIDWLVSEGIRQIRYSMPLVNGSPRTYLGVTKYQAGVENPISVGSATTNYTGHANHEWHALAIAYKVTGDRAFKTAMTGIGGQYATPSAQLLAWRASPNAWTALPILVGGAT